MPFTKHEIVPDVIPVAPAKVAKVDYVSGGDYPIFLINRIESLIVNLILSSPRLLVSTSLGNVLTPTQVKDQPTVEWDAEDGGFYTLCMTDPGIASIKSN